MLYQVNLELNHLFVYLSRTMICYVVYHCLRPKNSVHKNCHMLPVAWCEACGFSSRSFQLSIYLLLSYEIDRIIWLFSCFTVWLVYHFLDIVLMNSDRYRCIFRSTTSTFEITEYQYNIRFRQYCINFIFEEKIVKIKLIWPPIDRFHRYRRALYTPMKHASASGAAARSEARACEI
jgi:hypothetical protein